MMRRATGSHRSMSAAAASAADGASARGGGRAAAPRSAWAEVLLIGKPAGTSGQLEVLLPSGKKAQVAAKDARARSGDSHPVACAAGEGRCRVARYNDRAALCIQRFARSRITRMRVRERALRDGAQLSPRGLDLKAPGRSSRMPLRHSGRSHGGSALLAAAARPSAAAPSAYDGAKEAGGAKEVLARVLADESEARRHAAAADEAAVAQLEEELGQIKVGTLITPLK